MKKNATYATVLDKAVFYKTIESNDGKKIQLKFYNVSKDNMEALCSFIETTFHHNGTLNYLFDAFNSVKIPMFSEHNFIAANNKDGKDSIFVVYSMK